MDHDGVLISRAFDRFSRSTGIQKRLLAEAIGRNQTATTGPAALDKRNAATLSPSHLEREDVQRRVVHSLRRKNLPALARILGLDREGIYALHELSRQVCSIYTGHEFGSGRGETANLGVDPIDLGEAGLEHFLTGRFDLALPLLREAWEQLAERPRAPDDPAFGLSLRIGTDYAGLLLYRGELSEVAAVYARLLPLTARRHEPSDDRGVVNHRALAIKGASTWLRLSGSDPTAALEEARRAYALIAGRGIDLAGEAALLRDQAKPIVVLGLGWHGAGAGHMRPYSRAVKALDDSVTALERLEPGLKADEERLFTLLTRVECLAALNHSEEVRSLWDELASSDWVANLLKARAGTPIESKYRLSEIAWNIVSRRWDRALEDAERLKLELEQLQFHERARRVVDIQAGLAREDRTAALKPLMR